MCFLDAPAEVRKELESTVANCEIAVDGKKPLDFVMIFTASREQLSSEFVRMSKQLAPAGMLWISWPKKSSGVAADLNENVVREIGLQAGLVDVKVCAVTAVWSGLKFVRRVRDRKN